MVTCVFLRPADLEVETWDRHIVHILCSWAFVQVYSVYSSRNMRAGSVRTQEEQT